MYLAQRRRYRYCQVQMKGNEMKLEVMTLEQMGKKVALDEKKNGKRYAYEFALVKAWLADGGRVIPSRYDGLGTYLFQEGDDIRLDHTWSRQGSGKLCHVDRLIDEGFIIVPADHKISLDVKSPEWFMRTRKKGV